MGSVALGRGVEGRAGSQVAREVAGHRPRGRQAVPSLVAAHRHPPRLDRGGRDALVAAPPSSPCSTRMRRRSLASLDVPTEGEIVVIVGPEGGIAPEELAAFEAAGAVTVRLGDEVLRTSTAGLAAGQRPARAHPALGLILPAVTDRGGGWRHVAVGDRLREVDVPPPSCWSVGRWRRLASGSPSCWSVGWWRHLASGSACGYAMCRHLRGGRSGWWRHLAGDPTSKQRSAATSAAPTPWDLSPDGTQVRDRSVDDRDPSSVGVERAPRPTGRRSARSPRSHRERTSVRSKVTSNGNSLSSPMPAIAGLSSTT